MVEVAALNVPSLVPSLGTLSDAQTTLDPAIFNCICLYELRIEIAGGALTALPPQLSRLQNLTTLIVSYNGLQALPLEIATLTKCPPLQNTLVFSLSPPQPPSFSFAPNSCLSACLLFSGPSRMPSSSTEAEL